MQEIKKELTELKELISNLLELQMFDHKMKYGYLDRPLKSNQKKNNKITCCNCGKTGNYIKKPNYCAYCGTNLVQCSNNKNCKERR